MSGRRGTVGALLLVVSSSLSAMAQTSEGVRPNRPEPAQEIQAEQLSKLPKQTRFVTAEYPKQAEEQGIEASVVLLLSITAEGKVDSVGIQEPAEPPNLGFDEAAMAAAHQFQFEPAEVDGKPVPVQISYRYRFTLTAKPKAPEPVTPPPASSSQSAAPAAAVSQQPTAPGMINFRGVVRERGTRLLMPGVIVTVFREEPGKPAEGYEATADAEGRFQFVDLPSGTWKVLAEPPGYYPFRTTETVTARELVEVTYYVERGTYNPFDVTVTATRPKKEVSRSVLTAAEIEKIPGGMGDPLIAMRNLPGIGQNDSGLLIVRGSAPEDSQILIEGASVPLIYHFGGLRSVVPAGMLDSIEFYPGNYESAYGRSMGGIVDARLKKLAPKKFGGYVDVSVLDTGVYLEAPLGDKASIAVAGRRSYIDVILNAVIPDDSGLQLTTAPRYYDFQVLGTYRPTPRHELKAFIFGSDDRMAVLFDNPADIDPRFTSNDFGYSTTFYRGILSHRYVPNSQFENKLQVSKGFDYVNMTMAQFGVDMDFDVTELRESARYEFSPLFASTLGLDLSITKADIDLSIPFLGSEGDAGGGDVDMNDEVGTNVGLTEWYPGVYWESELRPGNGFLFVPGLRFDRHGMSDEMAVEPRMTGRWEFTKRATAKAGLGLFHQEPHFLEIDRNLGNPDLGLEHAIHYSAGLEYKLFEHLTLDGTAYYKKLSNLVSPTDRLVVRDGVTRPLRYDNGGDGKVLGMELVARHELANGFSGWLAYSLSRSVRQDSGSDEERLFDYDQTHMLTLVASYALPRNWQIGTRYRLVSGKPQTPVTGAAYNASTDEYDARYGRVNSDRAGLFHQLDVRVDKRWIYQAWMLTAYLDVQNIYNHQNSDGSEYNYNYRKKNSGGGMPIVPILGMRADF